MQIGYESAPKRIEIGRGPTFLEIDPMGGASSSVYIYICVYAGLYLLPGPYAVCLIHGPASRSPDVSSCIVT